MCSVRQDGADVCVILTLMFRCGDRIGESWCYCFFCQAEDCIRDLVRSRGRGDVYKRQSLSSRSVMRGDTTAPGPGAPGATSGGEGCGPSPLHL